VGDTQELPKTVDFSSEMVTSVTHLYRGEMHRMSVWRQRLDVTSNWAVIIATGLTTFTLGSDEVPHYILLLGLTMVIITVLLEGRRYRHLHHSKWRLYLLESGYFADVLKPAEAMDANPDWRRLLAADLRHTHFSISWFTAMRLRLRRNYLFVIYFISAVWVVKLFIHPGRPASFADFFARLGVGHLVPPWFVASTAIIFIVGATVLGLTCPPAEKLEDWSGHYYRRRVTTDDDE
jgi:uncharacterized membrane protein